MLDQVNRAAQTMIHHIETFSVDLIVISL